MSLLKVVCTLKYPSNACLSHLDNGLGGCSKTPVYRYLRK